MAKLRYFIIGKIYDGGMWLDSRHLLPSTLFIVGGKSQETVKKRFMPYVGYRICGDWSGFPTRKMAMDALIRLKQELISGI